MIRTLTGPVSHLMPDGIVVDVNGVGYLVTVPTRNIPPIGATSTFYIYTHVREDELALYGFASADELRLFRELLTVPSIGPKLALAILSAATPAEITTAIEQDNLGFFHSLSGVGKKSAAKIIVELKGKLTASGPTTIPFGGSHLLEALTTLGYRPDEVQSVLKSVPANLSLEEQVTWSLQQLARQR